MRIYRYIDINAYLPLHRHIMHEKISSTETYGLDGLTPIEQGITYRLHVVYFIRLNIHVLRVLFRFLIFFDWLKLHSFVLLFYYYTRLDSY